jgi:hypothetical protein
MIDARLAGACVAMTATLLGISRVAVTEVRSAQRIRAKTTPLKRNSKQNQHWQKEMVHRMLRRSKVKVKVKLSRNRLWRPIAL